MVFVRIKKIKGREYAYLVENKWTSKGSRQKVGAYLGKVVRLNKVNSSWRQLREDYSSSVKELVKNELENHGFKLGGASHSLGSVLVDLENTSFSENGKPVVLALNEGFLCAHTYKQLLGFKASEKASMTGQRLANVFLEAGLQVNEVAFVKLVESIQPNETVREVKEEVKPSDFYY